MNVFKLHYAKLTELDVCWTPYGAPIGSCLLCPYEGHFSCGIHSLVIENLKAHLFTRLLTFPEIVQVPAKLISSY